MSVSIDTFTAKRSLFLGKLLDPQAWDDDGLAVMRSGAKEIYFRRERSILFAQELWRQIETEMADQGVKFAEISEEDIVDHLTI